MSNYNLRIPVTAEMRRKPNSRWLKTAHKMAPQHIIQINRAVGFEKYRVKGKGR